MERIPVQSKKAPFPILSTLAGIVMDVNPLHPSNADLPIVFTPSGITIDLSSLHDLKALSAIEVTLQGITDPLRPTISVLVAVSIIALQFSRES